MNVQVTSHPLSVRMADVVDPAQKALSGARSLEPLIMAARDRFDEDRTLPASLVDAMYQNDLFRMWVPRSLGGAELDPLSFLTVIEELSRLDGSMGWCAVIPAGYARLSGSLDEDVAREIFLGSSRGILVGSLNPTGKAVVAPGGYRVSGRWSYGSFIAHGDWVLGNCIVEDASGPRRAGDGGPEFRLCLFPKQVVEVFDIWHVGGLRATGSNDYQVTELFVPETHTIPMPGFLPPPRRPGPLYAMPMTSTFVSCVAVVALGIARAAIEALTEIAATKATAGSSTPLRDKPFAQVELAKAEALLRSGRAYLFDELGAMWTNALAGRDISVQERAHVRLAAVHAARSAIQSVDIVYQLGGGASLFQGGRLDRCFRDINAAGQHMALSPLSYMEPIGRVLFGLPPGVARF
jgi:alkylation response protein AidB-like acyl-CoA dehydrogenase